MESGGPARHQGQRGRGGPRISPVESQVLGQRVEKLMALPDPGYLLLLVSDTSQMTCPGLAGFSVDPGWWRGEQCQQASGAPEMPPSVLSLVSSLAWFPFQGPQDSYHLMVLCLSFKVLKPELWDYVSHTCLQAPFLTPRPLPCS